MIPWFSHDFPIDLTIFLAQPRPANFSNNPGPVPRGSDIWQTPASWIWAQNMGKSGKVWNIVRIYSYLLDFLDSFRISVGYCSYFELYSYWYEGRPWIFEGWFLMESLSGNEMAFGVMRPGGQLRNPRTKWRWWKLGKKEFDWGISRANCLSMERYPEKMVSLLYLDLVQKLGIPSGVSSSSPALEPPI